MAGLITGIGELFGGVMGLGMETGQHVVGIGRAGMQLERLIVQSTVKVALNGIIEILKRRYPNIDDFLQATKKIKQRVKV